MNKEQATKIYELVMSTQDWKKEDVIRNIMKLKGDTQWN